MIDPRSQPSSNRSSPRSRDALQSGPGGVIERPAGPQVPLAHYLILAGAVLVCFATYVAVELQHNGVMGFPLDDPWIHQTFARNLARGWGFAYNPGEPVQGSTAPLWTLLLAFFHLFRPGTSAAVWIAKLLGAFFLWVAAVFAYRTLAVLTRAPSPSSVTVDSPRVAGLIAGVMVTTLCHFDWAMVSGMEVTLSLALVLAGLYYAVARRPGWRAYAPWVVFALAVYTRPECLVLGVFLGVDALIVRVAYRRSSVRWLGPVVWFLSLVPYFALNYALGRSLFPQTYVAKVGRTSLFAALAHGNGPQARLLLFEEPLVYFSAYAVHLWRANPVLVLLSIVGLVWLVSVGIRRRGGSGFLTALMALFYAPLLGMTAPYGTAAFQNGRYLGAPVGAAMILAACGAAWLLRQTLGHRPPEMQTAPRRPRSAGTPAPQRWRQASRVLYVLVGALVLFNAVSAGLATARNTASAESSVNRMQVAVGKWLELETPANAVIACNDVGAIGYFANRRVLDLLGLVTPDVVPYLERQPVGREDLGDLEYIRDRRPDYLAIFPDWFPHLKTARARFLKPVLLVDVPDNTASRWAFTPALHSFAGVLVLGLDVVPKPATMVVFEYDWTKDSGRSTPLSP